MAGYAPPQPPPQPSDTRADRVAPRHLALDQLRRGALAELGVVELAGDGGQLALGVGVSAPGGAIRWYST